MLLHVCLVSVDWSVYVPVLGELTVNQGVRVTSILLSFIVLMLACLEMMLSCAMLLSYFTCDFTVRSKKMFTSGTKWFTLENQHFTVVIMAFIFKF